MMRMAWLALMGLIAGVSSTDAAIQRCLREDGTIYFTDTACPPRSVPQRTPALPAPKTRSRAPAASVPQSPAPPLPSSSPATTSPASPSSAAPAAPRADPWQRPDFPAPPPTAL